MQKCLCNQPVPEGQFICVNCQEELMLTFQNTGQLTQPTQQQVEKALFEKADSKYIDAFIGTFFVEYMITNDKRISSCSEVCNCDLDAGTRDIFIDSQNGFIDRDAGASQWDSYVSHNGNVDRDLTSSIFSHAINDLKEYSQLRHICLITNYDTFERILEILSYKTPELLELLGDTGFYGLHSYYLHPDVIRDTIGRIYFFNTTDLQIQQPKLHAKIRDLK